MESLRFLKTPRDGMLHTVSTRCSKATLTRTIAQPTKQARLRTERCRKCFATKHRAHGLHLTHRSSSTLVNFRGEKWMLCAVTNHKWIGTISSPKHSKSLRASMHSRSVFVICVKHLWFIR